MLYAPRAFPIFFSFIFLPLNSAAACNAQRGGNGCKDRNGNLNQCFPSFFRHSFFSVSCLIFSDVIGRIFSDVIGERERVELPPEGLTLQIYMTIVTTAAFRTARVGIATVGITLVCIAGARLVGAS